MKNNIFFRCITLIIIWFISVQIVYSIFGSDQILSNYLSLVIMLIIVLYDKKKCKIKFNSKTGQNSRLPLLVLISAIVGCGLSFVNIIVALIPTITGYSDLFLSMAYPVDQIKELFPYLILTAIVEEFFYRGIIFNHLFQKYNMWKLLVYSSLLFAVAHTHPLLYPHTFITGIVLSYFYYRSKKIFVPIIIHLVTILFTSVFQIQAFIMEQLNIVKVSELTIILSFILFGSIVIFICKLIADNYIFKANSGEEG